MTVAGNNRVSGRVRPTAFSGMARRVTLVPIAVACLLAIGLFSGWELIKGQQLKQLKSDAHDHVTFIGAKLEAHVTARLVLGELIREEWLSERLGDDAAFNRIVHPKLNRFPDIQAINWVDRDGVIRWVNPLKSNEQAIGFDVRTNPAAAEALDEAIRTGAQRVLLRLRWRRVEPDLSPTRRQSVTVF